MEEVENTKTHCSREFCHKQRMYFCPADNVQVCGTHSTTFHSACKLVPIQDPQKAIDATEVVKGYLGHLERHIQAFDTESYFKGTNEEFRIFEEGYMELQQTLDHCIANDSFDKYEEIKIQAYDLKNRLDNSQLACNVSKHRMHLTLAGDFDPNIEIDVQVSRQVTKELTKMNEIFEQRIRSADQRNNKQAQEKEDLETQIVQLRTQIGQLETEKGDLSSQVQELASQVQDSQSANEELSAKNSQLEEEKASQEETITQLSNQQTAHESTIAQLKSGTFSHP
jgi:chromosome segregation ATPase